MSQKTMRQKWNNNYPKIKKLYEGRSFHATRFFGLKKVSKKYSMDIRNFVRGPGDWLMTQILDRQIFGDLRLMKSMPVSERLMIIQQWVIDHLTYVGDKKAWEVSDFWQLPEETLTIRKGDCEDGALLLASLLLNAGIEPWRVRVTCGFVKASETAKMGGHAYVTYCDGRLWYPLDWCYYSEVREITRRRPIQQRPRYKDVWFSFNNQYCWSPQAVPAFYGRVTNLTRSRTNDL